METVFWVRCGDGDDYHKYKSIRGVAAYLSSQGVTLPLVWCGQKYGVSDDGDFNGNNYISLYRCDPRDKGPNVSVTDEELATLNRLVEVAQRRAA